MALVREFGSRKALGAAGSIPTARSRKTRYGSGMNRPIDDPRRGL